MKIYTKMGDKGQTSLVGGSRISKADPRLETYGTVDELNSCIGVAISFLEPSEKSQNAWTVLEKVQHQLFNLGSRLACEDTKLLEKLPPLNMGLVAEMESSMDQLDSSLPRLQQFILPGGSPLAAHLHFCRTVCRRAERILVHFAGDKGLPADEVQFLNRLSDFLFVLARAANHSRGIADVEWKKE